MAFAPFPISFNIYFYSWRARWQAAILAGNIVNKIKGKLFSSCGNWVMMYVFLFFGYVLVMQGNINISLCKTIQEFLKFSSFKLKKQTLWFVSFLLVINLRGKKTTPLYINIRILFEIQFITSGVLFLNVANWKTKGLEIVHRYSHTYIRQIDTPIVAKIKKYPSRHKH